MAMLPLVLVLSLAAPSAFVQEPASTAEPVAQVERVEVEPVLPQVVVVPEKAPAPDAGAGPKMPPMIVSADRITLEGNASVEMQEAAQERADAVRAREMLDLEHSVAQQSQAPRQVQAGDRLRLSFYNLVSADNDMNRVYDVTPSGHIEVKYLGRLTVAGRSLLEAQALVHGALVPTYYQEGVISVSAAFEPAQSQQQSGAKEDFIVQGMVARPGSRSWSPGMTIERALEMAGGLTDGLTLAAVVIERPVKDDRGGVTKLETISKLRPSTPVLPGDRVSARLRGPGDTVTIDVAELPSLSGQWVLQADGTLRRAIVIPPSGTEATAAPMFAVNGEVHAPGTKAWKPGMTVLQAVALAYGMTSKGKYGHINRPIRDDRGNVIKYEQIKTLKDDTPILAGDVLVIARKWFGG
jgi:polysaccharide export outer membrane protein